MSIFSLISQAIAPQVAQAGVQQAQPELGDEANPIVVGRTAAMPEYGDPGGPEAPNLGNSNYLEEAANVRENSPERTGRFGVKGTLRDILGTLGDAFLVQSGNNPLYQQRRQQEQVADALAGFTDSPMAAMAAMERLAALPGGADMATQLQKEYMSQSAKAAEMMMKQGESENERYMDFSERFARVMGAATPETYERLRPLLEREKRLGNLGDEYLIPDEFDPDYAAAMQMGGMPTSRQVMTAQGERRLDQNDRRNDISQQNADANTLRASRPPQARQPRAMTESERAIALGDKPRSELTSGERLWLDDYYRDNGRSGRRSTGTPPASGNSRFRIIRD